MEAQKNSNSQSILSKNRRAGGIAIPDSKMNYRARVTLTARHKNRYKPKEQNKGPRASAASGFSTKMPKTYSKDRIPFK
jgi:hypothetical protein